MRGVLDLALMPPYRDRRSNRAGDTLLMMVEATRVGVPDTAGIDGKAASTHGASRVRTTSTCGCKFFSAAWVQASSLSDCPDSPDRRKRIVG